MNRHHTSSQRPLKVGEELKRVLAFYFQDGQYADPIFETLPVTVSEVRMSPDLKTAKVFVTTFDKAQADLLLSSLKKERYALRQFVAHNFYSKFVPQLIFKMDESFDQAERINALLEAHKEDFSSEDE